MQRQVAIAVHHGIVFCLSHELYGVYYTLLPTCTLHLPLAWTVLSGLCSYAQLCGGKPMGLYQLFKSICVSVDTFRVQ